MIDRSLITGGVCCQYCNHSLSDQRGWDDGCIACLLGETKPNRYTQAWFDAHQVHPSDLCPFFEAVGGENSDD